MVYISFSGVNQTIGSVTHFRPQLPSRLRPAGLLTPLKTAMTPKFLIHQLCKNHHAYAGNNYNHNRAQCWQKEAGPVVVLAEVGRNGHDLARTSVYNNDSPSPTAWSPSCRIRHASIL